MILFVFQETITSATDSTADGVRVLPKGRIPMIGFSVSPSMIDEEVVGFQIWHKRPPKEKRVE